MYDHPYFMVSSRPEQIACYDTIVYPFDFYVWVFTFGIIIAQFILLLIAQNLWSFATGKPNPRDYIFQGFNNKNITKGHLFLATSFFRLLPLNRIYT